MLEDKSLNLQGRMSNTYLISPKTSKVNICIDWFSFTADQQVRTKREESDIQAILRLITPILKVLKVEPNSYTKGIGKAFYKYRLTFDEDFIFFFDGPVKDVMDNVKSFMFEMSGKACRRFDEKYKETSSTKHWYELAKVLMDYKGFNVTRIDTPIDDYNGDIVSYDYFVDKIEKGEVQCSADSYTITKKSMMYDNFNLGESIKIGSTSSGRMLMVYNKKLERENEGYSTFHDYWYRYELRTKTDNSNRSTRLFLTLVEHEFNLNEVVPGLFMDYIRLLQPNEETLTKNKNRVPTDPKWEEFLNTVHKTKLQNQIISECTIKTKSEWILKAVSKALAMLRFSEDKHIIKDFEKFMAIQAIDKMENIELDAINNYRINCGHAKVSKRELEKEQQALMDELGIIKNHEGIYIYEDGSPVEYYKKV